MIAELPKVIVRRYPSAVTNILFPSEPSIVQRSALHYAGVRMKGSRSDVTLKLGQTYARLLDWLSNHRVHSTGAVLTRVLREGADFGIELDIGAPIAPLPGMLLIGEDDVLFGELPAGSYATLVHVGPHSTLAQTSSALLDWLRERGLRSAVSELPEGEWLGRVEHYLVDPAQERDASRWRTEVAVLLTPNERSAETPEHPPR